uniref:Uncharacterized protein n=1 Tax=Glossina morsitans morsitans TaxID=37546 RepID=A0A1B0FPM4_GLOMM
MKILNVPLSLNNCLYSSDDKRNVVGLNPKRVSFALVQYVDLTLPHVYEKALKLFLIHQCIELIND